MFEDLALILAHTSAVNLRDASDPCLGKREVSTPKPTSANLQHLSVQRI